MKWSTRSKHAQSRGGSVKSGLVVILGCAHRGIVNTLRHAQQLTGKELAYSAIGGAPLFRASEERIERTMAEVTRVRCAY